MSGRPMRTVIVRVFAGAAIVFLLVCAALLAAAWEALGKGPDAARRAVMEASPQWGDGVFENPEPLWNDFVGMIRTGMNVSPVANPSQDLPVVTGDRSRFAEPPGTGLRITWLGHSTQIIEIDGVTVITDPIFGGRAAPFTFAGPAPWYAPPIPLSELPPLDAVLISHDHYDHLQVETIQEMATWDTRFVVPLGVGAHLAYWGVPDDRITEVDWWDTLRLGDVELVAVPARHASGRQVFDQNRTLWTGYALRGPQHRVLFSGDTGLFPGLTEIGERLGPFDVTMFEVGAYDRAWPDWHLGPEQAVRAHRMTKGRLFLPIHWGMWNLASHGWTEPVERVLVEAERWDVLTYVPRPGESFEPDGPPALSRWWPDVPWQTAEEHPVVATKVPPDGEPTPAPDPNLRPERCPPLRWTAPDVAPEEQAVQVGALTATLLLCAYEEQPPDGPPTVIWWSLGDQQQRTVPDDNWIEPRSFVGPTFARVLGPFDGQHSLVLERHDYGSGHPRDEVHVVDAQGAVSRVCQEVTGVRASLVDGALLCDERDPNGFMGSDLLVMRRTWRVTAAGPVRHGAPRAEAEHDRWPCEADVRVPTVDPATLAAGPEIVVTKGTRVAALAVRDDAGGAPLFHARLGEQEVWIRGLRQNCVD